MMGEHGAGAVLSVSGPAAVMAATATPKVAHQGVDDDDGRDEQQQQMNDPPVTARLLESESAAFRLGSNLVFGHA